MAISTVGTLIDDVSPDTILTFGSDGMTFHPDHVTVHTWVTEAWKRGDGASQLLYTALETEDQRRFGRQLEAWGVYMTNDRPVAVNAADLAVYANLDGPVLDRKLAALAAMPSQMGPAKALLSESEYRDLNSREAFVAA